LGDGTMVGRLLPEQIDPNDLHDIATVAVMDLSSFALSTDGSIWDWGANEYGQLGIGTSTQFYTTPQHLLPPGGYRFTSISSEADAASVLATLAPIPEPSVLLLLTGLPAVALLLGRRRRDILHKMPGAEP